MKNYLRAIASTGLILLLCSCSESSHETVMPADPLENLSSEAYKPSDTGGFLTIENVSGLFALREHLDSFADRHPAFDAAMTDQLTYGKNGDRLVTALKQQPGYEEFQSIFPVEGFQTVREWADTEVRFATAFYAVAQSPREDLRNAEQEMVSVNELIASASANGLSEKMVRDGLSEDIRDIERRKYIAEQALDAYSDDTNFVKKNLNWIYEKINET